MLGPHTHRDNPVSRIMCAPVAPPVTVCKHLKIQKKIGPFFVFPKKKLSLVPKMGKRSDKTNTGEGGKGKKGRTVSDDAGGKSLSDTSTSAGVQSTAIRTSVNIFEASKSDKPLLLSRLGWALETCAENFPCHQRMPVSNLYAKTSGRTWRIGGSQI